MSMISIVTTGSGKYRAIWLGHGCRVVCTAATKTEAKMEVCKSIKDLQDAELLPPDLVISPRYDEETPA